MRRIVIQIGGVYTTFCHREGIHLQKYAIEMGGVSRYFLTGIGVRGRCDSPKYSERLEWRHLLYRGAPTSSKNRSWARLNGGQANRGQWHVRGDQDHNTMSPRREVPTMYWQAIAAHNLVVLQQGEDVAFVWQYGCRSDRAERQCTGKQNANTPLFATPLLNVP